LPANDKKNFYVMRKRKKRKMIIMDKNWLCIICGNWNKENIKIDFCSYCGQERSFPLDFSKKN
jgi:rubrerythrin